ncbi:DUF748 domain-containing protein [Bowmanella dokdonensis]|uniref:AsmA family protein n=1 Tax=Bowmanella dokdonensis TaxID=751969 RepID=A0A939DLT0_9ALTE|nr:AsmA family protein [Bowmanella dokdonensis]MBN7824141.1 AsmA family protein [Bowmanella dokdonensis]
MKKLLLILLVLLLALAGAFIYLASGADELIRTQLEKQGSKVLGTPVTVSSVELVWTETRLTISGLDIDNPKGYSDNQAFHLGQVRLDLGTATSEPYQVEEVLIEAPEVLYEVNAQGQANLMILKDNLQSALPANRDQAKDPAQGPAPLLAVQQVTVSNARLRLDISALETGDLQLEQKVFDITLPTFSADPVGVPDGLPADQVGSAIMNSMLANLIDQAKDQIREKVKDKAREKLDEKKDELMDKAKDKLKGLLDKK